MLRICVILVACLMTAGLASAVDDDFFEARIRPTLADVCFRCHGDQKQSGGLRVDSLEALLRGGDSGPAIVPGSPATSLLIRALRRDDDVSAMPPAEPLDNRALTDFSKWVADGAVWPSQMPAFRATRHWAWSPLSTAIEPDIASAAATDAAVPSALRSDNRAIDRFVDLRLAQRQMRPVGRADKRALIRRATLDLTGLPPTLQEVEAFVTDESRDAFARVVDRLLASPHYGEQWGRHWLDIVRYADTAGETADFPAPDAWRYRNYVIEAFNADKPYDQFIREQVAGDIFAGELAADAPASRYAELINATGFISIARRFGFDTDEDHYLTIDDTLDMLGKAVLGLTISCARCHDHKYDPISTSDYYGLYGIFASTRYPAPGCEKKPQPRDLVRLMPPSEHQRRVAELDEAARAASNQKSIIDRQILERWAEPAMVRVGGQFDNGGAQHFASAMAGESLREIDIRRDEMIVLSILPRENQGADSTGVELVIHELGGESRVWDLTHDLLADPLSANPHADSRQQLDVWHCCDAAGAPSLFVTSVANALNVAGLHVWRGADDTPSFFVNAAEQEIKFLTVTMPGRSVGLHPGPNGGVCVIWRSPMDGKISVAGRAFDLDGIGGDGVAWQIERRPPIADILMSGREATQRVQTARAARAQFDASLEHAYAVQEGEAQNAHIHLRGDPKQLGAEAPRRFLTVLGGQPIASAATSGRRDLADWLTRGDHPLAARVLANRVWQHHFGAGLVRTPNDFGARGDAPAHPELLDYLAGRLIASGWSIKRLHREIMLSDAYQRASDGAADLVDIDPENRWLARFSRRRLLAEEIRDAMLSVSGELDPRPGAGHPFPAKETWRFTQHNPFLGEYESRRRSIYLMVQRIRRDPFFSLFDGADASASTGQRFTTTVPTQSLFFLNDPFVHDLADRLSVKLMSTDAAERVDSVARRLFARVATADERAAASRFAEAYWDQLADLSAAERERAVWAAWVRVQFASNEFLYVD